MADVAGVEPAGRGVIGDSVRELTGTVSPCWDLTSPLSETEAVGRLG